MRLDPLCTMELVYAVPFRLVRPYGESGMGWGRGTGVVSGERLAGTVEWSNHPTRRGDGTMLPNSRGVITTDDGADVLIEVTGRSVVVERDGQHIGRLQLMMLLETEAERYRWLNETVCVCEGVIDPIALSMHIDVLVCVSEI